MKLKSTLFILALATLCGSVRADLPEMETAQYAGWSVQQDLLNGNSTIKYGNSNALVSGPTVVYDNIPSGTAAGSSTVDLNRTWGDRVTLSDNGFFDRIALTLFNSATGNTGVVQTAVLNVSIYNATTFDATNLAANTSLLDFSSTVDFGAAPLDPGFFTVVDFAGLNASLGDAATSFSLATTNLVYTQRVSNVTGGTIRMGTVFYNADSVGTQYLANNNWYRNDVATPASGYVAFAAPTPNLLGTTIGLTGVPEPSTISFLMFGLAGLTMVRRRFSK